MEASPRLLHDLRLALAALYSLPLPPGAQGVSPKDAHDYLMHIQSRNVRRRIQSIRQSLRDQRAPADPMGPPPPVPAPRQPSPVAIDLGSSWLACLALLVAPSAAPAERLFAAQTLLHRLRRARLAEAVDGEAELPWGDDSDDAEPLLRAFDALDARRIGEQYRATVGGLHPFLAAVLATRCSMEATPAPGSTPIEAEERAKGELSLLALLSILFLGLVQDGSLDDDDNWQHIHPLASTLGGAIAVTTLRLCYSFAPRQRQGEPNTVVSTIAHALSVMWGVAIGIGGDDNPHRTRRSRAMAVTVHACLSSIPECVMGSMHTSGARGRLSMEPKSLQSAMMELRMSGVAQMQESMQQLGGHCCWHGCDVLVLSTSSQWAKFLPLSHELLLSICPLINKNLLSWSRTQEQGRQWQVALSTVIAIMEAGTWTVDVVLGHSLGLSEQQQVQQQGKKRQSNKSKRRHQEKIVSGTSDYLASQATREVHIRGESACFVIFAIWESLRQIIDQELQSIRGDPNEQVDGEGAIGCLVVAANACLPHIVRNPSMLHGRELLSAIIEPFQKLTESANQSVRALAVEALHSLHISVARSPQLETGFESAIIEHFYICIMGLATACAYPSGYFDSPDAVNDEQLEIERNDVRDLIRAVTSTVDSEPSGSLSMHVLFRLVDACKSAIAAAHRSQQVCPEQAVHAFSALAKPLNQMLSSSNVSLAIEVSKCTLQTLIITCQNVIAAFDESKPLHVIIPVSRTANIAIASMAPFVAACCYRENVLDPDQKLISMALKLALQVSTYSIKCVPELVGQSVNGRHMYDIRGAMRGPFGEDHVGCLALMRLFNENNDLTLRLVEECSDLLSVIVELHTKMKQIEKDRGRGVWHGAGVTPKSRRILLNVLCRLGLVTGSTEKLLDLFRSSVATFALIQHAGFTEESLYDACEAILDTTAFPGHFCQSLLFNADPDATGLHIISSLCLEGYRQPSSPHTVYIQWNRLRAAIFYLLSNTGGGDISPQMAKMLSLLVRAECDAINQQCHAGQWSQSRIFCDEVLSEDSVPAGVFVRVFSEVIHSPTTSQTTRINSSPTGRTLNGGWHSTDADHNGQYPNLIHCICECKESVLTSVMHECPAPSSSVCFVDPRPTLLEAWLLAMSDLMTIGMSDSYVMSLLTDTLSAVILLLFYSPSMGRSENSSHTIGLSFDGPQSLALMKFLSECLSFPTGSMILSAATFSLLQRLSLDFGTESTSCTLCGMALLGSALFRAAQGGLPPWAVESIPEVYEAFFHALGRDVDTFGAVLRLSMDVRWSKNSTLRFGCLLPGQLLSGRCFESLSNQAKDSFLNEAKALASEDDATAWRRLKVLIKAACGGKKKDSGFDLKPAFTGWDFDRI